MRGRSSFSFGANMQFITISTPSLNLCQIFLTRAMEIFASVLEKSIIYEIKKETRVGRKSNTLRFAECHILEVLITIYENWFWFNFNYSIFEFLYIKVIYGGRLVHISKCHVFF